ncbi:MAG: sterol desaturase family protein [Ketobacteraceae bacterium]|nr:sterol desaturase family protein [Ketobacteraceae bacterium]
MENWIIQHEAALRACVFFAVLLGLMLTEVLFPRRPLKIPRTQRWPNNLGLVFFNSLLLRIIFPAAAVGMALTVEQYSFGLFHWTDWPHAMEVILTVVLLDLVIYGQHVIIHKIPLLWRLHKVHHADLDYDVTTGSRFHPLEIILSLLIKFAFIAILGAPVLGVILFEMILNAMAMFNHSNIRLPVAIDGVLRRLVVTPDMHRVHHSRIYREANRNFGFSLSIWDRIFRTYQAQPEKGHDGIQIGLERYDDPKQVVSLKGMLFLPLRK